MQLKPLSVDAIPSALAKAERYRFLNEPGEAESICLDILAVDPGNQPARVMLILALTDQLLDEPGALPKARALAGELDDAYEREYYSGLICERRGRAQIVRGGLGSTQAAREWLKDALAHYDKAEPLRAPGNDDAILRWNACVRLLEQCPESDVSDDPRALMLE